LNRPTEAAKILMGFALSSAEHRILVVRGTVAGAAEIPSSRFLAIESPTSTLNMIGRGDDIAFCDHGEADVLAAMETPGAKIVTEAGAFPLDGEVTAIRHSSKTVSLRVRLTRANGEFSGAVDRLLLVGLEDLGL
jgi:hypothetical protein